MMFVNLQWKAAGILAIAHALCWLMRGRSAAARSLTSLLSMLAVLLLPAFAATFPVWRVPAVALPGLLQVNAATGLVQSGSSGLLNAIIVAWLVGAAVLLIRMVIGYSLAWRISRKAQPFDGAFLSERVHTPIAFGLFRPRILLPVAVRDWDRSRLDLVMTHERAHIARLDGLSQFVSQIVCILCWFNPLAWSAARRLRVDCELACDDSVLQSGARPSDYAEALLAVSRSFPLHDIPFAIAMASPRNTVQLRIHAVLDETRRRGSLSRWSVCIAALCLIAAVPLAAIQEGNTGEKDEKRVYKIGAGVKAPIVTYKVEPKYTKEARAAKIEGAVVLSLIVTETGDVKNIEVKRGLEKGLDQNAVAAVETWKFQPATKDGKPVSVFANVEVNFRLL
jgi:TonB family protein